MLEQLKSLVRASPLYPVWFARQNAPRNFQRTSEDIARREIYSQFVSKGDLVFDIGANIGGHTKLFLDLGCGVVCVEPQQICAATLRRSFSNSVTIARCALSDQVGFAVMKKHDTMHALATISDEWLATYRNSGDWFRRERITTSTFDELIGLYGVPKFAKIDVEGNEIKVFSGLSTRIHALCFEYTPEMISDTLACLSKLDTLGSYRYNLLPAWKYEMHFKDWLSGEELKSFLLGTSVNGDIYARSPVSGTHG